MHFAAWSRPGKGVELGCGCAVRRRRKRKAHPAHPSWAGLKLSSLPRQRCPHGGPATSGHIPRSLLPSSAGTALAPPSGASLSPCPHERMGCPHVTHALKGHWDSTDFGVPGFGAHSLAPLWRTLVRESDVLENPGFIVIPFKSRSKPGASSELFPRAPGFGPVSTCSSQKNRKERNHTGTICHPRVLQGGLRDKSCETDPAALSSMW